MTFLEEITRIRAEEARQTAKEVPADVLAERARGRQHHSLKQRLCRTSGPPAVIAELKKASPSAGLLAQDYKPAEWARQYRQAGAAGISVLTEPHHFLGSGKDLETVRAVVDLPVLRKDFISVPYQLLEAAGWGADVILLIVAALERSICRDLAREASRLGLECLMEVHDEQELDVALESEEALIGVNSRNLKTLQTDTTVFRRLAPLLPADRVAVAESGIRTFEEMLALREMGYRGFLVGESLLRGGQPGLALRRLLGAERHE